MVKLSFETVGQPQTFGVPTGNNSSSETTSQELKTMIRFSALLFEDSKTCLKYFVLTPEIKDL